MLSDNKMDSDKSSGVPISLQMSTLYFRVMKRILYPPTLTEVWILNMLN